MLWLSDCQTIASQCAIAQMPRATFIELGISSFRKRLHCSRTQHVHVLTALNSLTLSFIVHRDNLVCFTRKEVHHTLIGVGLAISSTHRSIITSTCNDWTFANRLAIICHFAFLQRMTAGHIAAWVNLILVWECEKIGTTINEICTKIPTHALIILLSLCISNPIKDYLINWKCNLAIFAWTFCNVFLKCSN